MRNSCLDITSKVALVQDTALFGHWKSLSILKCDDKADLSLLIR